MSISDPLGIIAKPFGTLNNDKKFWCRLKKIVEEEAVGSFVVGKPLTLRGEIGHKAMEVQVFMDRLRKETGLEVYSCDERFSTSIAEQTLTRMNTKKKNRNAKDGTLDSMAAAIILQDFLDRKKNSLVC